MFARASRLLLACCQLSLRVLLLLCKFAAGSWLAMFSLAGFPQLCLVILVSVLHHFVCELVRLGSFELN
jgi:hypothetical protein